MGLRLVPNGAPNVPATLPSFPVTSISSSIATIARWPPITSSVAQPCWRTLPAAMKQSTAKSESFAKELATNGNSPEPNRPSAG